MNKILLQPAVVLGLSGMNSLNVTRSLGKSAIPVYGFHCGNSFPLVSQSQYMQESKHAKSLDELTSQLVSYGKERKYKSTIFATGDDYVLYLEQAKDHLAPYFQLPLSSRFSLKDAMNKELGLLLGTKAGFSSPSTMSVDDYYKFGEDFDLGSLSYPVLLKPGDSLKGTKKDMKQVANKKELVDSLQTGEYDNYVIQEYIDEPITSHYEVHLLNTREGPLISGMIQKNVAVEFGDVTKGAVITSVWNEDLIEPSINFALHSQFHGPLDINVIRHNNKYYFLEANFRTSANLDLDRVAGLDLPVLHYYDNRGHDSYHLTDKHYIPDKTWVSEFHLLSEVKAGRVSQEEYQRYMNEADSFAFYDKTDLRPYFSQLGAQFK